MIRKSWDGEEKWMLTAQQEHARLAALFAASWSFSGPKPSEEVFVAITHHDDGWKEFEEQFRLNGKGDPISFNEMDPLEAIEIWTRGSVMLAAQKKYYAARLVAGHFTGLASTDVNLAKLSVKKTIEVGKFIGQQQIQMAKWEKDAATPAAPPAVEGENAENPPPPPAPPPTVSPEQFQSDLRFLQVCDLISILVCSDFAGEMEIPNVPYLDKGDRLVATRKGQKLPMSLNPLPFRKNMRDHLSSWIIPRRVYENGDDLRATIEGSKLVSNEIFIGEK